MNETLNSALNRTLKGDEVLLAGFGLERLTTTGSLIPPRTHEWEERLSVQGNGNVGLLSRRSIADVSSEEIGEFRSSYNKDVILNLVRLVQEARLDELPPFRIEPSDVSIRITFVIGGTMQQLFIGVQDPTALAPLQPLLQELDRLSREVRKHPVMTLGLNFKVTESVMSGDAELPVTLGFSNSGNEGFWLAHPGVLKNKDQMEQCSLLYGRQQEVESKNITPLPMEIHTSPLVPTVRDERILLWVPGTSEVQFHIIPVVNFPAPGTYLTRAVYSSYMGKDTIGGQHRLRGCVFSNEAVVQVK